MPASPPRPGSPEPSRAGVVGVRGEGDGWDLLAEGAEGRGAGSPPAHPPPPPPPPPSPAEAYLRE